MSHKIVPIVIDGTPFEVPKELITYAELVTLANPDYPQNPQVTYSVTYTRGPHENHEGTLSPGGAVRLKDGMVFRVSRTGQS